MGGYLCRYLSPGLFKGGRGGIYQSNYMQTKVFITGLILKCKWTIVRRYAEILICAFYLCQWISKLSCAEINYRARDIKLATR